MIRLRIQFQIIYQRNFLGFLIEKIKKKLIIVPESICTHLLFITLLFQFQPIYASCSSREPRKNFFSGWQTDCIFIKENMCNTQVCTNRCSCCVVFHNDLLWLFIFVVMHSLSLPQKSTRHAFISQTFLENNKSYLFIIYRDRPNSPASTLDNRHQKITDI